ncbi:tyrosine-type recombinase/integrase [Vibrio cyclitrophicus]
MITLNSGVHHVATVRCKISDTQIRKYARDPRVKQLKDVRYSLYYIFGKDRQKGSWRLFSYQNTKQSSVVFAHFPKTSASQAIQLVKDNNENNTPLVRHHFLLLVTDVLEWHISRQEKLGRLEKNRLIAIRSMFNAHLYSMFDGVEVTALSRMVIDDYFVVPFLQSGYSLSYAKGLFQLVKVAFSTAYSMKKLFSNPMSDMRWTDFVSQSIRPKPPKLMPMNILDTLNSIRHVEPIPKALCTLMLYHGTRIGETRLAKWSHINFETKQWLIPAGNTKTKRLIIYPLTDEMIEFLKSYKAWLLDNHYKGKNLFPLCKRDKSPLHRAQACKLVRAVSCGKWSAHDLRKLARTIWADIGVDYFIAESLLNHAKDKLDVIYIHSQVELQKRDALVDYHKWLKKCW